jgi:hypothetical protein
MKRPEADVTVAASAMATTIACIVVLVLLEAYLVRTIGVVGWLGGLVFGFKLWLGFAATTALINSSFQSGSKKLYLIDQGYHLVGIALAGAILAHQVIVT